MKAKKILGLIACAGACASFSAFATTTYSVVNEFSGTATTTNNATWNKTGDNWPTGVTVESGKLVLDNDASSQLTLKPDTAAAGATEIVLAAKFVAFGSVSDLPSGTEMADVQVGMAVVTNTTSNLLDYYGYFNNGTEAAWTALSGANATETEEKTVKITINYGSSKAVTFAVQGANDTWTTLASSGTQVAAASATSVTNISCYGAGELASINAKGTTNYDSLVDAIEVAGGTKDILVGEDGTPAAEQTAANGLPLWKCDALNLATDTKLTAVPRADTLDNGIPLAVENITPDTGLTVQYNVVDASGNATEGSPYAANAIVVPLVTGTYTIDPVITKTPSGY